MPVGEIAGEILGGLFRIVGQFFVEVVGELLIRGVGYAICRRIDPRIDAESWTVILVGVVFWATMVGFGVWVYSIAAEGLAVDRCLDAGRAYDYEAKRCLAG